MRLETGESISVGEVADSPIPAAISGLELELRPLELVVHWRRCGLTADWLASYLAYDFDAAARATAQNVLSTVINELLENAVKFSADKQAKIRIAVTHHGDFVRLETNNLAAAPRALLLRETFEELGQGSLDALFARRIAESATPNAPGVGLLILKRDYAARQGVRLTPLPDGNFDVLVRVDLDTAQVERA
jgi:hypothetical protein